MLLADFRQLLADNPDCDLQLIKSDGQALAAHFHVTEVGRVEKQFVDCGGKRRSTVVCMLQTLVASDFDHRLSTTKLAKIMSLADSLDLPGDTEIEVEHQERSISIDTIADAQRDGDTLRFRLAPKQTACLAEDACGLGPTLNVVSNDDCCDTTGCC